MSARVLMLQGASSSVGKSLLTVAICRIFARRGWRVAPFKAQNMSNNAAVCTDGGEIGRAQAVQAAAAGVEPTVDMNPILLKPEADSRSQVIVLGRPHRVASASGYYRDREALWEVVTGSLDRLRETHELVVIEGAGSPAELNLKENDIVNMAVARYASAPVLLVGDIDRGGIFAQLLGTLELLPAEEQALVRGFLVNKFRGDLSLFASGVTILEERAGIPVLGVIPWLGDHSIPEEDAVALEQLSNSYRPLDAGIEIAVIRLPRIANFDDFAPLAAEPGVHLRYVTTPQAVEGADAIILPGTKSTAADLSWLHSQGITASIRRFAAEGGAVVGICGGYQMLGRAIHDPEGVESPATTTEGLALLPIETSFHPEKTTARIRARVVGDRGWLSGIQGETVTGYEIHMGRTWGEQGWLEITERNGRATRLRDGAASEDGRVWGAYIHGLFENESLRRAWLSSLGCLTAEALPVEDLDTALERLATVVEGALDMERLEAILWES